MSTGGSGSRGLRLSLRLSEKDSDHRLSPQGISRVALLRQAKIRLGRMEEMATKDRDASQLLEIQLWLEKRGITNG